MPPSLSLSSIVSASPDQVFCDIDEEVVVLSFRTAAYYGLSPVAATAWTVMQEPIAIEQLRDILLDEFTGITADQCTSELIILLEEMIGLELVVVDRCSSQ